MFHQMISNHCIVRIVCRNKYKNNLKYGMNEEMKFLIQFPFVIRVLTFTSTFYKNEFNSEHTLFCLTTCLTNLRLPVSKP